LLLLKLDGRTLLQQGEPLLEFRRSLIDYFNNKIVGFIPIGFKEGECGQVDFEIYECDSISHDVSLIKAFICLVSLH
jgi:hypothetical protein